LSNAKFEDKKIFFENLRRIILYRKNAASVFSEFVRDLFGDDGISVVRLDSGDMERVRQVADEFGFDFDDAYQYVTAEKFNLVLVSFDGDFDRADRKRVIPADIRQVPGTL
jgi:hypothetical protein